MATTEIERAQYVLYEIVYYIVCDNISLDLSVMVGKRYDVYWPDLSDFIFIQDSVI